MKKITKEEKQKLFVINLERILTEKNMSKKELADRLCCTPQTISNYINRGVSEKVVSEISKVLGVSEQDLYRTEAENEFYALKKINLERAVFATAKGRICIFGGLIFLVYTMQIYGDSIISVFSALIFLLFFEVIGAVRSQKLIDRLFRVAMRSVELLSVVTIFIYPFLKG